MKPQPGWVTPVLQISGGWNPVTKCLRLGTSVSLLLGLVWRTRQCTESD